jgi:aryl-alcohol dehydrogenase-like predicted oxidoreductase
MIDSEEQERSFDLLDEVYALGCTSFDTAHQYARGDSERTVGRWVNERGVREEVVIIGKGAHHNEDRRRVTPFDITADLFDSLARFRFGYIDLYLLHRDDPSVPVRPIVKVLNEHASEGRIRAFGASNWTHERIEEANEYARENDLQPFVASSINFSLAEQVKEPWPGCLSIGGVRGRAAREWYARSGMPLFAWSSLAGGFFSGRFSRDNVDSFEEGLDRVCAEAYGHEENFERLDRVRLLAQEKGLTVSQLAQLALAYVMNQPLNVFAIVGHNSGEEFRANAEASEVGLTSEELAWLDLRSEDRRPLPADR